MDHPARDECEDPAPIQQRLAAYEKEAAKTIGGGDPVYGGFAAAALHLANPPAGNWRAATLMFQDETEKRRSPGRPDYDGPSGEGAGYPAIAYRGGMPTARALDPSSVFSHGLHQMLVLTNGAGRAAIERAHLPIPLGASSSARHRADARDPFTDPERPLRFTLASDVASAAKREQGWLLALARLTQVTVDALPEVEAAPADALGRVSLDSREDVVDVRTTRKPNMVSATSYRGENALALAGQTGLAAALAERLALSVAAHEALGNDYLVSPVLAAHRDTDAYWGRHAGVCTVDEALFLAGVKARFYGTTPIDQRGSQQINTGWLYDAAAVRLSPALRAALAGALSPTAAADEAQCTDHLLTIRSRLRDLLVCRDELARLERREVLGKDWQQVAERNRPVIGGSGNDLIFRVQYHVTAGLNAFATILDNLAWVVAAREHITAKPERIGFDRIVRPAGDFPPTWASESVRKGVADLHPVRRSLALRSIRNVSDHRAGFSYGWVMSVQGRARTGPEMLAVWIPRENPRYLLPEGNALAADDLLDLATYATEELLLLRPRALVEAAVSCAAGLTARLLKAYEWGSADWLGRDERFRQNVPVWRLCRGRWHRGLWGAGFVSPALRESRGQAR